MTALAILTAAAGIATFRTLHIAGRVLCALDAARADDRAPPT